MISRNLSFLLLLATASASSLGRVGWSSTTSTTTSTTTPAPTTLGWEAVTTTEEPAGWGSSTTEEPTTTPGWGQHQRPANTNANSELAMVGSGGAVQSHSEHLSVAGNGWIPGEASFGVGGDVFLYQDGGNAMASEMDANGAVAANQLYAAQGGEASVYGSVLASGTDISYQQNGAANTAGQAVMVGAEQTSITIS